MNRLTESDSDSNSLIEIEMDHGLAAFVLTIIGALQKASQ